VVTNRKFCTCDFYGVHTLKPFDDPHQLPPMFAHGKVLLVLILAMLTAEESFKESQLKFSRVKDAFDEKAQDVKALFASRGLVFSGQQMFIRAFKTEEELEVWIKDGDAYKMVVTYPFCTTSGTIGPKRKEGDLQIPEGVYYINHFNPYSTFHLSLGINYPNASDKILSDKQHPGGAIYIHGNCVSIGCIPITDEKIKELYVMAVEAKNARQEKIPVHIFPARLDAGAIEVLIQRHKPTPEVEVFWTNLSTVYQDFQSGKKLRNTKVNQKGQYYF
jgi:murein L,D-transpeptidase YafK